MKLFFTIFGAILAAAAVIWGVQSYRENQAQMAELNAQRKEREIQMAALERDANQKRLDLEMTVATNWRNHARATRWLAVPEEIAVHFNLGEFRKLIAEPRPAGTQSEMTYWQEYVALYAETASELRRAAREEQAQLAREMRGAEDFDHSGLKFAEKIEAALPKTP